ncbi:hypothetical protein ACGFYV_14430 [Streptomyces sp. NPDC048297]|uniref:hypothetical protein n=1 Tax=Streptomyces sp. NPDC048297 TaxID=3365531 RepID=UPI00371598B2
MADRTQRRDRDTSAVSATEVADAPDRNRFSQLPERIRPEDMVETRPATVPDPARVDYNADEWLVRYCL